MAGAFGSPLVHILLRLKNRKRFQVRTDRSGYFTWHLAPGKYVISRLNYWDTRSGSHYIVPKLAFRLPKKGKVYFIGTLKVELATKRNIIGDISGPIVHIKIEGQKDKNDI